MIHYIPVARFGSKRRQQGWYKNDRKCGSEKSLKNFQNRACKNKNRWYIMFLLRILTVSNKWGWYKTDWKCEFEKIWKKFKNGLAKIKIGDILCFCCASWRQATKWQADIKRYWKCGFEKSLKNFQTWACKNKNRWYIMKLSPVEMTGSWLKIE